MTAECVRFGPEKVAGRLVPVRCVDSRCLRVGYCAREVDDGSCPVLTKHNLGHVLRWLNERGLGHSTYRLVPSQGAAYSVNQP